MHNSISRIFAYFAIVLTIFSQFAESASVVMFLPLWVATLLVSIKAGESTLRFDSQRLFLIIVFCVMGTCSCLAMVFTGEEGYLTGFFMLVVKSLLLYFTGWFLSPHFNAAKYEKNILLFYVAASAIYAVWFAVTYVPSLSAWVQSQSYLFVKKNSFGQIVGIAALCSVYLALNEQSRKRGFLFICIAISLLFAVSLAQCRTAMIAFCIGTIVLLCLQRNKKALLILAIIVGLALALSPTLRTFIAHALFLDKYSGADLNTFSSGRMELWAAAIGVWLENPLIGTGSYYIDNFYLNALTNVGILGTLFVLAIWVPRIVANVTRAITPTSSKFIYLAQLAAAFTVFYLFESFTEGNPPFGPGSSSFLFWLICGLLDARACGSEKSEPAKVKRQLD